jgi:hypothetical protein
MELITSLGVLNVTQTLIGGAHGSWSALMAYRHSDSDHPGRLASRRAAWMILFQHGGQRSLAQPNFDHVGGDSCGSAEQYRRPVSRRRLDLGVDGKRLGQHTTR